MITNKTNRSKNASPVQDLKDTAQPTPKTVKLGIDVHLDRYVVVRIIDGGTPQPPQIVGVKPYIFAAVPNYPFFVAGSVRGSVRQLTIWVQGSGRRADLIFMRPSSTAPGDCRGDEISGGIRAYCGEEIVAVTGNVPSVPSAGLPPVNGNIWYQMLP